MPGCRIKAITPDGPDLLHVDARSTRPGGRCPDCGRASRAVHSRYRRHPADLPSLGAGCASACACAGSTAAMLSAPGALSPNACRSWWRLTPAGPAGSVRPRAGLAWCWAARRVRDCCNAWSCRRVWVWCCAGSAVCRCPKQRRPASSPWMTGRCLKGARVARSLVDLERRRVVDLSADRTSTTAADWLRQRPGIKVIARDLAETQSVCGWLHRVCPRCPSGRSKGRSSRKRFTFRRGGRPLACAGQHAQHVGALAGPNPRPAALPDAAARRRPLPPRPARPCFPAWPHRNCRGGRQPRPLACCLRGCAAAPSAVPPAWRPRRCASMPAPRASPNERATGGTQHP